MEPFSSMLEYTHLFKMKQEELTSYFISVWDTKAFLIFTFSLPHNWMKIVIIIYIFLGPNEDFLTYMYSFNVKWEEKIDIKAKI